MQNIYEQTIIYIYVLYNKHGEPEDREEVKNLNNQTTDRITESFSARKDSNLLRYIRMHFTKVATYEYRVLDIIFGPKDGVRVRGSGVSLPLLLAISGAG